ETTEGRTVVFTLTVHNKDNSDLQFINYWAKLRSKSGPHYSVKLIEADKNKNRIPAQSSKDFTFYSKVNSSVQLQDLLLQIIKWDFSAASYERKLGEFTIPTGYAIVTPVDHKRLMDISGTAVKSSIHEFTVDQSEEYYLAAVVYELENTGSRSVKLPAYQFYIRTANGTIYQLDTASLENVTIQPKEKKKLELKAAISLSMNPENWQLAVTLPEGAEKVDLPVAFYHLPATKTDAAPPTPIANKKVLVIDKISVSTHISKVTKEKVEKNNDIIVYYNYENIGNKAVKIPKYDYDLRTAKGLIYPLTTTAAELAVNPGISKAVELAASLPFNVDIADAELVVKLPVTAENKFEITVAVYKVPASSKTENLALGKSYRYTNKSGSYTLKLNSIQRLPWEDQDIIAAEIVIRNTGLVTALPLIKLSGYFLLDGVKVDIANTKLVKLDNTMGLPTQGESSILIYTKVPYTYQYKEIKLVVQEAGEGETGAARTIVEFKHTSEQLNLSVINAGESYNIPNIGKRTGIKIRNMHSYASSNSNIVYAEVEMENLEKRLTKLPKLEGYFKTLDDAYYPAKVSLLDKSVTPNGKVLLSFWSKLPKTVQIPNLQLIMGEGLTGDKITTAEGTSDAFIKALMYSLPPEINAPKLAFGSLDIYPYTISFSKIIADTNPDTLKEEINFNYRLHFSSAYDVFPAGHKIVMEFMDGPVIYSREFELDGTSGDSFKLGENAGKMVIDVPDLLAKIGGMDQFQLNIYDQFEGHKKLLSSQSLAWFIQNY
ncbi:MAG TPA: hypothetical protein VGE40_02565, partial [Bacilli bacterium]